jgi:hypothetical protein
MYDNIFTHLTTILEIWQVITEMRAGSPWTSSFLERFKFGRIPRTWAEGLPFDEPREEPDKQEVGERPKLIEILETVSAYDSDIRYFADQCRWEMNEAT